MMIFQGIGPLPRQKHNNLKSVELRRREKWWFSKELNQAVFLVVTRLFGGCFSWKKSERFRLCWVFIFKEKMRPSAHQRRPTLEQASSFSKKKGASYGPARIANQSKNLSTSSSKQLQASGVWRVGDCTASQCYHTCAACAACAGSSKFTPNNCS